MDTFVWLGIVLCLSQSATLSGLNLAFFSISKLQLGLEAKKQNKHALKVQKLRQDSNFLLVTILWANVAVNVLLALLSESVLAGVAAFLFSTVAITVVGEILPQAYFSRHALVVAARLSPLLRLYQVLLFPIAKPTALLLDWWLGKEALRYYQERDIRKILTMHMESAETEIAHVEGQGALNFLALDDLPLKKEGEEVAPESVIQMEFDGGRALFPAMERSADDPFIRQVEASGKKWIVLADRSNQPRLVMNSDEFIRDALFGRDVSPHRHCHKPILVTDGNVPMGKVIPRFRVYADHAEDDVIEEDIILLWGQEKKVITGSDILGRLLRDIVKEKNI